MTDVKIAVLIPTKNRLSLLKRCISSVYQQTMYPDEVIIVNDGSTDGTSEYLNEIKDIYKNFKIINKDKSGGVNSARNIGINLANSDWVAFLDDDDEFLPKAIELMKERILNDLPNDFNLAYFNTEIVNSVNKFIGGFQFKNNELHYDPTYFDTMTKFNLVGDCKPVIRKTLFKNEKYRFPERVNGFESYTMNLIARDGKGIRYYPDISTIIHQENILTDRLSINASKKNPLPLLVLHLKQILEHFSFYIRNLSLFFNKIITIIRLFIRFIINESIIFYNILFKKLEIFKFVYYCLYLYKSLEDFKSKNNLIKVFLYRFFGLNFFNLKSVMLNFKNKISVDSEFYNNFKKFDLTKFGFNINLYSTPESILGTFILKQYENENTQLCEGDTVIDCGGFCGDTGLFFADQVKNKGLVFSFEFIEKNLNVFKKNILINKGISNIINIIEKPLWSTERELYFIENGSSSAVDQNLNNKYQKKVSATTIDNFIKSNNLEKVDFIKMDIEGSELEALKGAKDTVSKFKPKLAICIYHKMSDFKEIPKFLKDLNLGYKFYLKHSSDNKLETVLFAKV